MHCTEYSPLPHAAVSSSESPPAAAVAEHHPECGLQQQSNTVVTQQCFLLAQIKQFGEVPAARLYDVPILQGQHAMQPQHAVVTWLQACMQVVLMHAQ